MTSIKLLSEYRNGNYIVRIYSDGTKIRYSKEDEFVPVFPESIDLKITNKCDLGCLMCHEESSIEGKHAKLDSKFLDTLVSGTELAIGGGNPLAHPELVSFLTRMKDKGVICNLTVNQYHLVKNLDLLQNLINNKLIYGLGISILNDNYLEAIMPFIKRNKNTVLHLIAGIIDKSLLEKLYNLDLKILILGYKKFGRGTKYYSLDIENNINYLKDNILNISKYFKVISFDNLAINQLDMKNKISKEKYEESYMGDDGSFTMYIDLVKEEFAKSSTEVTRYKILDNIIDMFNIVRNGD